MEATLEDLYRVPDDAKAEIVNGKVVVMSPNGRAPGYTADEIFVSLRGHARRTKTGLAVGDNKGFRVGLPHRKSFSHDAAFYVGPNSGMKFFEGAPIFAVLVRSEEDYAGLGQRIGLLRNVPTSSLQVRGLSGTSIS